MGRLQALVIVLLLPMSAAADWGAVFGLGGFKGEAFAGAAYIASPHHAFELDLGQFPIDGKHGYQLDLQYTLTPFHLQAGEQLTWAPLTLGVSALYVLDDQHFFIRSPGRYPSPNYYEETQLRFGLNLGTEVATWYDHLHLSYEMVILDTGIAAALNNKNQDTTYYLSSGLKLRYDF